METKNTIKNDCRIIAAFEKSLRTFNTNPTLRNVAGAYERLNLLRAAVEVIQAEEVRQPSAAAVNVLIKAFKGSATADLIALLPAIPNAMLARAVTIDGTMKTAAVARLMAEEIAHNETAAVAVQMAANAATRAAAIAEKKAARKAAQKQKKEAAKQAAEYAQNNTCGVI